MGDVVSMPRGNDETLISLAEVARRLGYSQSWVRDRIKHDGLPSQQHGPGSQHRFRWSEVEEWWQRYTRAA